MAFIGSPVEADEKELMKIAKKLKKEKVNVDIVSFGEDQVRSRPQIPVSFSANLISGQKNLADR